MQANVCHFCRQPIAGLTPDPRACLVAHAECSREAHERNFGKPRPDAWLVVGVVRGTGERKVLRRFPTLAQAKISGANLIRWDGIRGWLKVYDSITVEENPS